MMTTAHTEVMIGCRKVEFIEEDLGQAEVLVLPGMDEDLLGPITQQERERRELDELRSGADDCHDPHEALPAPPWLAAAVAGVTIARPSPRPTPPG
jgi:hypothetical protein